MVLRTIELGNPLNEVIFCDTSKEFPSMYQHLERMKEIIESVGIKFTILKSEKSFDYYMFEHLIHKEKITKIGYSWMGSKTRWCTYKMKTQVIERYLKKLNKNVTQLIGIALDEKWRIKGKMSDSERYHFPLVEWNWTEKDALKYCFSKGLNWDGLYNLFNRVSCWCCPLQGLRELRILKTHFPALWNELREMDSIVF